MTPCLTVSKMARPPRNTLLGNLPVSTIQYRQAARSDLQRLLPLLELLFSIEEDFSFSAELQLYGLEMLLTRDDSTILVADRESAIGGMVTGQLTVSTAEGGFSLLVEDLVVAPDFRGQGVGRSLLEAIAAWGNNRGASRMQLLADKNNTAALDFYRQTGWQETQLICLRKYHEVGLC